MQWLWRPRQTLADPARKVQAHRAVDPPSTLMIPLMTVKPHSFMTFPKTPAAVFSDDLIERLHHRLVACRNILGCPVVRRP